MRAILETKIRGSIEIIFCRYSILCRYLSSVVIYLFSSYFILWSHQSLFHLMVVAHRRMSGAVAPKDTREAMGEEMASVAAAPAASTASCRANTSCCNQPPTKLALSLKARSNYVKLGQGSHFIEDEHLRLSFNL
jgi:hypothetical protein